ncbi:uncharacterized protein N7459_005625 [Penicillium hispanicum]|uniref:uncharacterized protein n=1 Tax=Penicillium hispanicum TaxID=1080232 RepID=UPI002541FB1B|nr:uncharacterized protein N7459_005625 [Penicillium hispanicum]KAJ5579640.1 hypothetical protein N7459_005625 [Penicillium hispanicum]
MAAPASKDTLNLVGTWELNRKLSDDPDKLFALQGVPWVVRKVLRYANLSLQIAQAITSDGDGDATEKDENGAASGTSTTTLHIKQVVHPGGFDSDGTCPVNGKDQEMALPIFGDIVMSLQYISLDDVPDETLRQRLSGGTQCKVVIDEAAHNKAKGWTARVMWGFEIIDGKRYFTRNATTSKDEQTVNSRMVYDYRSC